MATGAYDANGIWQYGESDPIALFSDLLNLGMESTSDAFTDDRSRITFLEQSVEQSSTFVASSQAARDSYWGIPANATEQLALQNKGARTVRTDTGSTEQYFGVYNVSTNPGGRTTAGWYTIRREDGAVPRKPTTVNVSGAPSAAATISPIGTVTFDAAAVVSLNGVFTAEYTNYRIIIEGISDAIADEIRFRLRASGTDATAAQYFDGGYHIATGAGLTAYTAGGTSSLLSFTPSYAESYTGIVIDVVAPNLTRWTKTFQRGTGVNTSSAAVHTNISCLHANASSYDGFTILTSSTTGLIAGTVTVYGYNKG